MFGEDFIDLDAVSRIGSFTEGHNTFIVLFHGASPDRVVRWTGMAWLS
jgi:hypothetical protein